MEGWRALVLTLIILSFATLVESLSIESVTKGSVISPCRYKTDTLYDNGTLVDCSNLGLKTINPEWFPLSTTTVLLNHNSLDLLENVTFVSNKNLRKLNISYSEVSDISINAFQGVELLETLDLEYNPLNYNLLNYLTFKDVPNLVDLRLAHRTTRIPVVYPRRFLRGLRKVKILTLSTPVGPLEFDGLFEDLTSVRELVLTGSFYAITNDTFQGFDKIPLQSLTLMDLRLYLRITRNAFQHLLNLTTLRISNSPQQLINNTLLSLEPFKGRNMTSLIFNRVGVKYKPLKTCSNEVITLDIAQYLNEICVRHFSLTNSKVHFIEQGVFLSPTWQRCTETIDLRGNPLLGDRVLLFRISLGKSLTSLKLKNCRFTTFAKRPIVSSSHAFFDSVYMYNTTKPMSNTFTTKDLTTAVHVERGVYYYQHTSQKKIYQMLLRFPPNLEFFQYASCAPGFISLHHSFRFLNANNIKHVDMSDNGIRNFIQPVYGFTNVSYMDISRNNGQHMSVSFLDTIPTVQHLKLAGMQLNSSLALVSGSRFFQSLTQLKIIDLSSNGLSALDTNAFQSCPLLQTIDLSRNKFKSIPIHLSAIQHLQQLDMSYNSLLSLSVDEMKSLDDQVKRVSNLSLHLAGNLLSCGCSSIKFLAWLKHTSVNLDLGRDYLCIDQYDALNRTIVQINNLGTLWRLCSGVQAFYVSIILLAVMMLCYISCFFFIHFQTFIMYTIITVFTRNFTVKASSDYRYGVFIGYADQDYRFACFTLRRYLEDVLKVTTYVRDRDLLPATDMAASIIEAINSSWRVLLVVSPDFLQNDHRAFFNMKAAVYCVEPLNPKRVLLVVERRFVEQLPLSLLRIVPEENIIEVDKPFPLGPEERQTLSKIIKS